MIKSTPNMIIAEGTDWRFLNELKRELKAWVRWPKNVGSWLQAVLHVAISGGPLCARKPA